MVSKEELDQGLEDVKVDSVGPRVQEILARELGEDLEEIVMEQKRFLHLNRERLNRGKRYEYEI